MPFGPLRHMAAKSPSAALETEGVLPYLRLSYAHMEIATHNHMPEGLRPCLCTWILNTGH